MSLFDSFDEMFAQVKGAAMKAYEENQKYQSVTSLTFKPVPAERAKALKAANTGLFGLGFLGGLFGRDKAKFIESIEQGRTVYTEVLVLAREHRVVDRSENDPEAVLYQYYYKVADLNGNVIREDVPMIDDKYSIALEYNNGDSASQTGCADVVDPGSYRHMYLVCYYLGDDQHFVLLSKEQLDDMTLLMNNAGSRFLYTEDGVGYRW
jgi:hypothetical protein